MEGTLRVKVIHVAGMRVIVQDTDGFSRGLMMEGVMPEEDML